MHRFLPALFVSLLGCSSRQVATRESRDPIAQLRRFEEFAPHLTNTSSRWKRLDGLDVTLANNVAHIARSDDPDAWIELVAVDEAGPVAESIGGARVLRAALPATDVVQVIEPTRYEEYRVLYDASAPSVLRYRVRRGPGIASLRLDAGSVVALSAEGHPRISSAPAFALDDRGSRRTLTTRLVDDTLELSLDTSGLAYPIAVDPLWTPTPDLAIPRTNHGAAPIPGGKAMIAGGNRSPGSPIALNTTFAYDPTAKTWTPLANMPSTMDSFVMTMLPSGKILVTGGNDAGLPNRAADLYDPATNAWTSDVGNHGSPYRADVVAPLSGDRALAVSQPDALLWSLADKTFTAAGTTTVTHGGHTATTLAGDKVLVVGGASTADLWDPATKKFSAGGTLTAIRTQHTATVLTSGKVLFIGGAGLSTAEVYDPATKTFGAAGAMSTVRTLHTATLLPGDRVMVTGGRGGSGSTLSTTEIYDAATNTWALAAPMSIPRSRHTATALPGPKLLVVGGDDGSTARSTAEVFEPATNGATCTSGTECASGFCADSVCCDTACNGQCEACDVSGSVGTCSVVKGLPHGTRSACEAGGTGVCARACDGSDRTKCNFAATTVVCSAAACAAGTSTPESHCDGAGSCPAVTPKNCAPYACGGTTCQTSCGSNADCAGGFVCDLASGMCVVAVDSRCSIDRLLEVPTDPASPTKSCAPFACDTTTGKCATRCVSSLDCATGAACDTASGTCAPAAAPATEDSGGCTTGRTGPSSAIAFVLIACACAARRRRW